VDPESQRVVLVGQGQVVQRDVEPEEAREPVALMEAAARAAAEDAGLRADAFDTVAAVEVIGWRYPSAATLLAARLGTRDTRPLDTTTGGNTPQLVVGELARRIRRGEVGIALVAGAEAIRSARRARARGVALPWTTRGPAPGPGHERLGDARAGHTPREERLGLVLPSHAYPLFETALRARCGRSPEDHQRRLGTLCARLSEVAATNPHAWFPKARSAEEIATPSPTNRVIAWPYTKYMNAVLEVDQGAALIVTSAARARALGVAEERLVDLWGHGEDAEEPWFPSERPRLDACPAQRAAIETALAEAGVEARQIDAFDLYSCFPVAVELACEALGIADDDPRPLTVTGGLAYAGGPGNAYSLHAIARMVERIRETGQPGLVTALGWYLTKHAAGVYGRGPRPGPARTARPVPRGEGPALTDSPRGPVVVEAYTVVHARDGAPSHGIVLGRDAADRRFAAETPRDRTLLEEMERRELVGARGNVRAEDERSRSRADGERLRSRADGERLRFEPA
jgi:acetyl-CoA C-acetyltransferase